MKRKTSIGYLNCLIRPARIEIVVNGTALELKGTAFGTHYVKVASGTVYVILSGSGKGAWTLKLLKVLAIGNSFKERNEYLHKIAKNTVSKVVGQHAP